MAKAWTPTMDAGHAGAHLRPWTLSRPSEKLGGIEYCMTANFTRRRFATERAAQACADKLNEKEPTHG